MIARAKGLVRAQASYGNITVLRLLKHVLFCFSFTPDDAYEILPRNDSKDKLHNSKSYFKEAQNSNISVRSLGSNGPFSAGNHAITRGFVR